MVWLPDWKWKEQQQQKKGGGGKGGGSSWGRGGGGGGGWVTVWQPGHKSKGQGKKNRAGIKDTSKTLWIGNIKEGTSYQDLKAHCDQAGTVKWAEVFNNKGKGTGAVGFASAAEAQAAVPQLNGSMLNGKAIQVDSWEKQNPK